MADPIHIFINGKRYELTSPDQTGAALKELAHIPLTDVLFLQRHGQDEVIGNDTRVHLENGAHLHSQPPADYGQLDVGPDALGVSVRAQLLPQADGWTFLVLQDYPLPDGYEPRTVRLLVKVPPIFPTAQPDCFWVSPRLRARSGQAPAGTSDQMLLGESWQCFSWHLKPGAWVPGVSTLRDYMRCIRARFERGN
jgi:hypothetical protein